MKQESPGLTCIVKGDIHVYIHFQATLSNETGVPGLTCIVKGDIHVYIHFQATLSNETAGVTWAHLHYIHVCTFFQATLGNETGVDYTLEKGSGRECLTAPGSLTQ